MSKIRSISAQLPRADEEPRWFAFRTAFKREKMVDLRLQAEGVTTYVPLRVVVRHYKTKRKVTRVPLLSTYIFVRLTAKQYPVVLADPDVYEIVRFQGEVGRVTDEEIEFLRAVLREDSDEDYNPEVTEGMTPGTEIVVAGGALAGTKGVLVSQNGKHSFEVRLRTLGLGLRLTIPSKLLQPERVT